MSTNPPPPMGPPKTHRYSAVENNLSNTELRLGGLDPGLSPRPCVLGYMVWVKLDSHVEYTSFVRDGKGNGFVILFFASILNKDTPFSENEAHSTRFIEEGRFL